MLVSISRSVLSVAAKNLSFRIHKHRSLALILFAILMNAASLLADDSASSPASDRETIQILLKRIDQLEARVAKLESPRSCTELESRTRRGAGRPTA